MQTLGFFRQRLLVMPRSLHHHRMVLVGLDSIFAAESFRQNAQPGKRYSRARRPLKNVQLPLVKPTVVVVPAESCPIEVGLESAVTQIRLAAKRQILTAVSGLIARQTEDRCTRFHRM